MSKTQENLLAAFAGESQARNKYTYFAKVARKEGYNYIARIFEITAANEMQHAKQELELAGGIGDTMANLKAAIAGEDFEVTTMYPEMEEQAKAEGNSEAALLFRMICRVEAEHRDRFKKLLAMVEDGSVYKRGTAIRWKCAKCGYVHEGTQPPPKCPCCQHPTEYFEPDDMEY